MKNQPEISGPSGLKLNGLKLYLTIGAGDTLIPATGGFTVNPTPSSTLFDSVLELTLPADYETLASGFTLSAANQTTLNGGGPVTLTNAQGRQLMVRLVANLPNFVIEPRPTLPLNARESNLFGLELSGDFLYVVDASFNSLHKINIATGASETFATFAPKPNPTSVGPPFIEAVPDSIRLVGNNLLVSFLTGFPFVAGLAEVRTVNLTTRAQAVLISNLTTAIDVLPIAQPGGGDSYLVLEFSTNFLTRAPGVLKLLSSPSATPIILSSTLVTPTSLARDSRTGFIFVTEKSTGRLMRVFTVSSAGVAVSGRVLTPDGRGLRNAEVSITDSNGSKRTATTSSFGYYRFDDVEAGETYVIGVTSRRYRFASRLVQVADPLTDVDFVGME